MHTIILHYIFLKIFNHFNIQYFKAIIEIYVLTSHICFFVC
jgi:hypothetical protein